MTKLPDNIVQAATRLRRLIEQADTPDLRDTARRDLERLIQQHPTLRRTIERRFPAGRPTQF